jgi:hypothetical protein
MRTPLALLALATLALAAPAAAQEEEPAGPRPLSRFTVGGNGIVTQPVGDLEGRIGTGGGLALHGIFRVASALGVRLEGGFASYAHERTNACFSITVGCRIHLDLNTYYSLVFVNAGPQLTLPVGPLRPYAHGGAGFAAFFANSSVSGEHGGEGAFSTSHFDDFTFAWTGGGGLLVPISIRGVPVAIDAGATYHGNGVAEYLREEDGITDNPDGSITVHPTRSQANGVSYRLGVSVTFPRGR